jgi:hypothetical protein
LGFIAFDLVYRTFGATDRGVFGGLAHQFVGFLTQESD